MWNKDRKPQRKVDSGAKAGRCLAYGGKYSEAVRVLEELGTFCSSESRMKCVCSSLAGG